METSIEKTEQTKIIDMISDIPEYVKGQIYLITNTVNNKKYIGQTRTHMWNHGKYRPFGYIRRFKDHICEATRNIKKNQCKNNACLGKLYENNKEKSSY